MSRDWENTFLNWAKPPARTEKDKMDNALKAVKNAVGASEKLRDKEINVFAQGSYRNRTNVRQDSDVDICVLCSNTFNYTLPKGISREDLGMEPTIYEKEEYRKDVENALLSYLGAKAISIGNKAFDIHENTYRVDADVVPCFEYRYYFQDRTYRTGTAVITRSGSYIANYPNQNYDNGVYKNRQTGQRYKSIVRILKKLCNELADNGNSDAKNTPSYLLECMVYNVPNEGLSHDTYTEDVRWVLAHLCDDTRRDEDCKEWLEVNACKYLFHLSQQWTRQQANSFLNVAWTYIGFE